MQLFRSETHQAARSYLEAAFWLSGLIAVAVADPLGTGLISMCPFDRIGELLGLAFCPGCGLGHAVGFLVRGEMTASFQAHPLGIPAVAILSLHIVGLVGPRQNHMV